MARLALNLTAGITEFSSRMSLKSMFSQFGEVTSSLNAVSAGQIYLDGVKVEAEWRSAPAKTQDSRDFDAKGSNLFSSRDLMMGRVRKEQRDEGRSTRHGGRDDRRRRDRSRSSKSKKKKEKGVKIVRLPSKKGDGTIEIDSAQNADLQLRRREVDDRFRAKASHVGHAYHWKVSLFRPPPLGQLLSRQRLHALGRSAWNRAAQAAREDLHIRWWHPPGSCLRCVCIGQTIAQTMLQMRRPPRRRSADFFPTAEVSERRSRPGEPVEATEVLGSLLATGVGALMVAQSSGGAVGMACIPFVSWSEGSLREAMSEAPEEVTRRLRGFVRSGFGAAGGLLAHLVNGAALAQLGTAMLQFILNDPLSGLIGGGIAAIGCQTAHPAGFRLLPTYVVLSFCHGIMQVLLNLQLFASGVPLHAMTSVRAGLMGKLAVGTLVASPLVMFLGMGMGYCLHKDRRLFDSRERAAPKAAPKAPFSCTGSMADRELTALEHAGIGASVGSIEMAIMRPAVFWKTELQQQRFSLSRAINPSYCYRGLPLAIASIAPITCEQHGSVHELGPVNAVDPIEARHITDGLASERLGVAVVAGAASALVQCPCQLVEETLLQNMIWFYVFMEALLRRRALCAALVLVLRLGGFQELLMRSTLELSDAAATLAASAVSGTLGAALSHPADTLKTRLQAGALPLRPGEPAEALRIHGPIDALKDAGEKGDLFKKCFAGFSPRLFRLICCTYIYSISTEFLESLYRSASVDLVVAGTRVQVSQSLA
eukprot:g33237.t1